MATVWSVLMLIDGAIYNLICYVYEIFYYLATLNIFTEEHYQGIVNRIYVVLGLFMLFVLAYSLLRAIIDPDNFAKKENSFPNLIKNVIISLVIIVLLPTVFSVAFNIQNAVLNNDTIPKLILGLDGATEDTSGGGRTIAYYLFKAFLYPNSDYCVSEGYTDIEECRDSIKGNGWLFVTNGDQLTVMDQAVLNGSSFTNYNDYSESVRDGKLSYLFPISTVAGIFTLYVLLNFCFDMAIRVVKLAFYQIIAPIPVICRVMPGGKMKEVFDKWVQQIISIFLEVFIRIAVLAIGIYLINIVVETYNNGLPNIDSLGLTQRPIVLALIIMGIVIFMRQAPQILGDLLGLKTDGMKLGLMDKLAMGGGLLAGAAVGGGLTSAFRNYNATRAQGGGRLNAIRSAIGGAGSGAVRAGFNAKGAKNFKDMAGAASKGIQGATARKGKRDAYKASHSNETVFGRNVGAIPFVGGALSAGVGHIKDAKNKVGETLGFSAGLDALNQEKAVADEMNGFYKTMASYVEDNEMVANYAGLYDAEMKKEISSTVFDSQRYQEALNTKVAMMKNDSRYSSMSDNELYTLAGSELDRSQFTRTRTAAEMSAAIQDRQERLKMYDNLKKMATIKAVNEKLNDTNPDGSIKDGRFQAVVNQVEVFKRQNSTYDFVNNMQSISGVQWDSNWDAIMQSGDASSIDRLMKSFKSDTDMVSFFADSETAKNRSGAVSAEIAKKIQEKKSQDSK